MCSSHTEVLKRQLALRERWQRLGMRIDHEQVFFKDGGEPIRHLHYGWKRWRHSLERLGLRPRAPYKARHSLTEGIDPSQNATIEQAMQRSPAIWHQRGTNAERVTQAPERSRKYLAEREGFEPDSVVEPDQQATESESNSVPGDPRKSP